MNNNFWVIVILVFLIGYFGYLIGVDKAQSSINELSNLKIEYNKLNETYNQLRLDYLKLEAENKALKEKQTTLEQQIASYFLEQTAIDVFGIKKYQLLYDIIKIYVCNQSPSFPVC